MKKLFCIADVHSFYNEMMLALDNAGFDIDNPDHILIHCGDLLDRGPQALNCLKFVNNIPEERKILIKGNHEDLLEDIYYRGYFCNHDVHNMTTDTVQQLSEIPISDILSHELTLFAALDKVQNHPEWVKYQMSLRDYFEIDKYVFVHGWIPLEEDWRNGDWKTSRWLNGMYQWSKNVKISDKTIVCGHWHTSWGHCRLHNYGSEFNDFGEPAHFEPFIDEGIVAIDGCTAYSGIVNCYIIEVEDDKWQLSM